MCAVLVGTSKRINACECHDMLGISMRIACVKRYDKTCGESETSRYVTLVSHESYESNLESLLSIGSDPPRKTLSEGELIFLRSWTKLTRLAPG